MAGAPAKFNMIIDRIFGLSFFILFDATRLNYSHPDDAKKKHQFIAFMDILQSLVLVYYRVNYFLQSAD